MYARFILFNPNPNLNPRNLKKENFNLNPKKLKKEKIHIKKKLFVKPQEDIERCLERWWMIFFKL
jgi:hypothetical protein